jgi:NAD(P)-dependent dehydrogenase (short-subunit alcohol dehydrogenase family)
MLLEGKVAVVSGAAQGMGEAVAHRAAREGARVVVADVNDELGHSVVAAIRAESGEAAFVHTDIADRDQVRHLVAETERLYGRLDLLHNNAATMSAAMTDRQGSWELDEAVFDRVVAVNLKGFWMCSKYFVPMLSADGGGAIVNAASVAGLLAFPPVPTDVAYACAKAGVVQLTRVMAMELGAMNIRVNCYSPANIDSPMTAKYYGSTAPEDAIESFTASQLIRRLGTCEEVADLVLFLGSSQSSFITGENVVIDGGCLAWRGMHVTTAGTAR